jgi:tyrosyl-tRNA synthetase
MPSKRPTLQEALDVLYGLRAGGTPVLLLQDWSALVCNAMDTTKAIDSGFDVMLAVLRALDGPLMEKVTVLRQSECTLLDPSNYWISVINVGRKFNLNQIMSDDLVNADGVGNVIHRLMSVADVCSIQPSSWCVPAATPVLGDLVKEFMPAQDVAVPVALSLDVPSVRLHPVRPKGEEQDVDEYFLLDSAKEHAKSKLNKCFAEEKKTAFCPALQLARAFCFDKTSNAPLVVTRSDDNGGTVTYATYEALVADYASGALHPGDLKKGGLAPVMLRLFETIEAGLKTITPAVKTLKAEAKKGKK